MRAGEIIILAIGYFDGASLYAYLHMRLTDERDPVIAVLMSLLWPLLLPCLGLLAAAKLGGRR